MVVVKYAATTVSFGAAGEPTAMFSYSVVVEQEGLLKYEQNGIHRNRAWRCSDVHTADENLAHVPRPRNGESIATVGFCRFPKAPRVRRRKPAFAAP